MKTRLDEIIYAEMQKMAGGDEAYDCFRRAVDSSFRHGVERANDAWYGEAIDLSAVQPAPAEEKGPSGIPVPLKCCLPFWRVFGDDRRQGERRRGLEALNWVHPFNPAVPGYRIQQPNPHGSWRTDRRKYDEFYSPVDRRRP